MWCLHRLVGRSCMLFRDLKFVCDLFDMLDCYHGGQIGSFIRLHQEAAGHVRRWAEYGCRDHPLLPFMMASHPGAFLNIHSRGKRRQCWLLDAQLPQKIRLSSRHDMPHRKCPVVRAHPRCSQDGSCRRLQSPNHPFTPTIHLKVVRARGSPDHPSMCTETLHCHVDELTPSIRVHSTNAESHGLDLGEDLGNAIQHHRSSLGR